MNINLTGAFCTSGYGVATTHFLAELDRAGHLVAGFPIGSVEPDAYHAEAVKGALERARFYDKGAPSLRIFHQWLLAQHVGKGPHVGFPIFELDTLTPVERHHLQSQDLVLVCSKWARDVLVQNHITVPVKVVPLGVCPETFSPCPLPEGPTTFLHIGKAELRKGLPDIIEAFSKAFSRADEVRLILHCPNPFLSPEKAPRYNAEWKAMAERSPLREKIIWSDYRLPSQKEVADLMSKAHCGLFPARAEGWNLELSEMLAMGRHVVCTNYAGHTEYVTKETARLIEITRTEPAYDGVYFHGQGNWARVGPEELEQLIVHMRDIHKKNREGALEVNTDAVLSMREFSWRNSSHKLVEVLQ